MRETKPDILELLIRHELAVKGLYETLADLFPERRGFWQEIAQDEKRHSTRLEVLRAEESFKIWFRFNSRLKPQAIASSISYVESLTARATSRTLSLLEALSISKDIETALLEKQFSKIAESAPGTIRAIVSDLAAETEQHRKLIIEALEAEKRKRRDFHPQRPGISHLKIMHSSFFFYDEVYSLFFDSHPAYIFGESLSQ